VALLEKRRFLYNHSGDFPQVILIIPSHVPNSVLVLCPRDRKRGVTSHPLLNTTK
jgi:hypothetical protein